MANILTVTFNPAIDKSTEVAKMIPDRKLKCSEPIFEPGGGGINVARAIIKLGGKASAAYTAGGSSGISFTEMLKREKVDCIPVKIAGNTRENLVVYDSSSGKQYRFGMPGPELSSTECEALVNAIVRNADLGFIIVSGSMPPGVPGTILRTISRIAYEKGAHLIVDTSGEALVEAVNSGAYLIKPNMRELGILAGETQVGPENVIELARRVIGKGKCEVIAVSMAEKGAILLSSDFVIRVVPPPVKVISTVGAGDSMLAGIVFGLWQGKTLPDAARYGVACGTAATLNSGTGLCRKEDADYLYSLIEVS